METRERYIRWKVTLQVFSGDVWPRALLCPSYNVLLEVRKA
jgi:hypothetical protein